MPPIAAIMAGLVASAALVGASAYLAHGMMGPGGTAMVAAAATVPMVLAAALLAERLWRRPARRLSRSIRALLESQSGSSAVAQPDHHDLGELPAEIQALAHQLTESRQAIQRATDAATGQIQEQKRWLEVIVQSLDDGVIVCSPDHRILLYNDAVVATLGMPEAIGLGRAVFDVLSRPPVEHTLERLRRQDSGTARVTAPFVCRTTDARQMLHARIALIRDNRGAMSGYLVTLADISGDVEQLANGDAIRIALTRELRGVVGNLRAAAETMAAHPDMDAVDRRAFETALVRESETLSRRIEELGEALQLQLMGRWPMADLHVDDLAECLQERLRDMEAVSVQLVGIPLWLKGDSLSLVQVLDGLVRRIHAATGVTEFDLEALLADRAVYLDLRWTGERIHAATLDEWLASECDETAHGQRLSDILARHDCEPWSQLTRDGTQASVRLPLPAPERPQFAGHQSALPARPEFYDFGLMQQHAEDAQRADERLRDLTFVVFDCEMTGLDPAGGDEIIAIGAVRVVKHRVLTGEHFQRLINPGRPIPENSIRFHGITDQQVSDQPGIDVVLPQFRRFTGEAVLVAHNAAFDMKFISLKEDTAGVTFDNPVLDTLLLSSMLDGDEEDHSLDGLCQRYGIQVQGRHTALGDALATAELLVRLIERLESRGLDTLREVMRASNMAAQLRQRAAMVQGSGNL